MNLDDALETNRRLNRRVQALEGPYEKRIAKAQAEADYQRGRADRMQTTIDELEMHVMAHWIWTVVLAVALTIAIVLH